jgi:hypothetical protein
MVAGFGYVFAGAIGAATLATAGPMLVREYHRPGADKAAIAIEFAVVIDVVFRAIWQLLNGILLGAWWFGIARLVHADQSRFAQLSAVLAALAWIGTAFNVLGFGLARDATLGAGVRSMGDLVGLAGQPPVARANSVRQCGRSVGSTREALTCSRRTT